MENEKKEQLSREVTTSYHNNPFAYSYDSARIFYCNCILFHNAGTSDVYLNDIFYLGPGASVTIGGDQNEVDLTPYKISFRNAGNNLLQGWIKQDDGNYQRFNTYPANAFYTKEPDKAGYRRNFGRSPERQGASKGEPNNKWNGKQRGDF